MKKILLIIALFCTLATNAAQYWVGTGGNDSNPGTFASRWLTLSKASTATTNGDTVNVAGTLSGPAAVYPQNICLFGIDTIQSIISITAPETYGIYFWSGDYNPNPIRIRNIKFVGNGITQRGLYLWKKHNVEITNCSFSGFITSGISATCGDAAPIKATNFTFKYNSVYDCAPSNDMNSSSLMLNSQTGARIEHNYMANYKRGANLPGALIKFNFTQDCVTDSNVLKVYGNDDGLEWAFAVEYWNSQGGDVLSYNEIQGVIDMTGGVFTPGAYAYQTHIHHNKIGYSSLQNVYKYGIYIEGNSHNVLIEDNTLTNLFQGIIIYTNSSHASADVTIRRNLLTIGTAFNDNYCNGISHGGTTGFAMTNYGIYNNTIIALAGSVRPVLTGIELPAGGTSDNFAIQNNIIINTTNAPITTESGTGSLSNVTITNNLFYNNGGGNGFSSSGGITPAGLLNIDNFTGNPLFNSDYTLQQGSPAIDKGVAVAGVTFAGYAPDAGAYESAFEAQSYKRALVSGNRKAVIGIKSITE